MQGPQTSSFNKRRRLAIEVNLTWATGIDLDSSPLTPAHYPLLYVRLGSYDAVYNVSRLTIYYCTNRNRNPNRNLNTSTLLKTKRTMAPAYSRVLRQINGGFSQKNEQRKN